MPPRLGHKKSRLGCVSCKRRRVKCDEQKPCGACVRYGWQCSLTTSPGLTASSDDASSGPVASSATQQMPLPSVFESDVLSPPPQQVFAAGHGGEHSDGHAGHWLQDLELMHQWSTRTWHTMQHSKHSQEIWNQTVPRLALRNEYVMHGLLAVSALHLAHFEPSRARQLYITSTAHQNLAISGFRSAIATVTPENADAVFLASIFIASFAFASTVAAGETQQRFSLGEVADTLILLRGIEETLAAGTTRQWVSEGPLTLMLHVPQGPPEDPIPEEQLIFLPHLLELRRLVERRAEEMPPHVVVSINEGLDQLEHTYNVVSWARPVRNSGFVMVWPNILSMSFLSLIQEQHPIALVVLAYFCAMMHYYEDRWVWHTWGARVIGLIRDNLDADWQKWIEWPADIIDQGLKAEEVKHE